MSKKLRLIQAGVGGFGGSWVRHTASKSPDFDLVAIADISDATLADAGEAAGVPENRRFKSLERALDEVEADAVLSVTPPAVHLPHAQLVFSRGLHLMSEKPISDSLESAKEMVALAKKADRQLVISQNYRFRDPVQKLKQLVAEKTAGELGHGHIDFFIAGDFTGTFRETMPYVLLVDMAIHHVDLIRCITQRNITRVTARTFNPAWSWYQHHAGLIMTLDLEAEPSLPGAPPRNDGRTIPLSYHGDWSALGRATSWNGDWRLQCSEGSLELKSDELVLTRSGRWNKEPAADVIEIPKLELSGQHATLHLFAEAIRTGKPAEISGQDNLNSFAVIMAAMESAKTDRPVNIAEML